MSGTAWGELTMTGMCIVTRTALGGSLKVEGVEHDFLVREMGSERAIAVRDVTGLLELVPVLRPAFIDFECAEIERAAMRALVASIRDLGAVWKIFESSKR